MSAAQLPLNGHCVHAWRDRPYRETLTLRDGREVLLRAARRSDARRLQAFFAELSPRSRILRFHGGVKHLPDGVALAFATQVRHQHVAIVAVAATDDGLDRLVAEARYAVDPAVASHAEFALAVADDWQGLGLGHALLQRLRAHAALEGLASLEGHVMDGNEPMRALLNGSGARIQHEPGGFVAMLAL